MIRSENARRTGFVFIDIAGRDLGGYVDEARRMVAERVQLPPGYSLTWSGQYEYIERVQERLKLVAPATLLIITTGIFAKVTCDRLRFGNKRRCVWASCPRPGWYVSADKPCPERTPSPMRILAATRCTGPLP